MHAESVVRRSRSTPGRMVDLPGPRSAAVELERLGDAARLASKLHLAIGVSRRASATAVCGEVLAGGPAAESVAVGRAACRARCSSGSTAPCATCGISSGVTRGSAAPLRVWTLASAETMRALDQYSIETLARPG